VSPADGPQPGPHPGLRQIEQFIYAEARFADEHDYDSWEALWTDDALYWVPAGDDQLLKATPGGDDDPGARMAVIYDNRSRISTRLAQLRTGKRYSQTPPSSVRRVISNIEVVSRSGDEVVAAGNFILAESRERGTEIWAGRVTYRLRTMDGRLRLAAKTVLLVNRDQPLPTLAFLI
jgi:3-phenylpropionate/cinnamic acid dioxygenase small subunit